MEGHIQGRDALPTYQAGRFTKSEVFGLPFRARNATTASPTLWECVQINSLDEFTGTKLIFMHLHDGAGIPWEVVTPFKLQKITRFHVEVPSGMPKPGNSIFAFAMNQARYDSLPADLKKHGSL
ncbi:MAG: hypothetical protein ABIK82_03460 [Pseudomonadota bacterium]